MDNNNKCKNKQGVHFLINKDLYRDWRDRCKERCVYQTGLLAKWIENQLEE